MPGRIIKRNFGTIYHYPKADIFKRVKPNTSVTPGDTCGEKHDNKELNRYKSDRQEGQKTGL
jgi:hypothetical protein